jgi:septal ring factor EnvC (AmiA/AmiB activator)
MWTHQAGAGGKMTDMTPKPIEVVSYRTSKLEDQLKLLKSDMEHLKSEISKLKEKEKEAPIIIDTPIEEVKGWWWS